MEKTEEPTQVWMIITSKFLSFYISFIGLEIQNDLIPLIIKDKVLSIKCLPFIIRIIYWIKGYKYS